MHEWASLSYVWPECNCHSVIVSRQRRNVPCWVLSHRIRPCSRHRPQRGLHDALGPLGRAFLMPRPPGVVDSWHRSSSRIASIGLVGSKAIQKNAPMK